MIGRSAPVEKVFGTLCIAHWLGPRANLKAVKYLYLKSRGYSSAVA